MSARSDENDAPSGNRRAKVQTIAGHVLPEPRITPMAIWLAVKWIGLPVVVLGGLLDLTMQLAFGICTGLWCLAP